jgi:Serine dehydrogenase proteinase
MNPMAKKKSNLEPMTDAPKVPPPSDETDATPSRNWVDYIPHDDTGLKSEVHKRVGEIVARHSNLSSYLVLILYDPFNPISSVHSDRLYAAASDPGNANRDILLALHSDGGNIEPAYLISKALKRIASNNKFVVAVPRRAKSAATLISLGADEIHMGMMSQLGPVDPQIGGLPALALGNAVTMIAELAGKHPAASEMLTKYLTDQVPIQVLGYYERVGASAIQYAERLIGGKSLPEPLTAHDVADYLVTHYKDHSFVIDSQQAMEILGKTIVKEQTPEYKLADEIYRFLDLVSLVLRFYNKNCWLVGRAADGFSVTKASSKS